MSSSDVFASSPPNHTTYHSSPGLPPIEDIFTNKIPKSKPLRTGSHAAPIPTTARTTFTSAAAVLREAPEIDIDTEIVTKSPSPIPKRRRKPRKKEQTPPPPDVFALESSPSWKDKPWQKYKTAHDAETVSKHFPLSEKKDSAEAIPLEPAIARRDHWTPPPPNSRVVLDSDSDARELLSSADKANAPNNVFRNLQDQYGMPQPLLPENPLRQMPADVLGKRKQIELVSTRQGDGESQKSRSASPIKEPPKKKGSRKKTSEEKAPAPALKKKTRTITELAVAPYAAPPEDPETSLMGPATNDSLLNYFDVDGTVTALVEHQTAVMSSTQAKKKPPKQPPKTTKRTKKGTAANPILLSPSSALKQSTNQDFVFGTSSQLMHEKSPTMLRDLQAAILASNSTEADPFEDEDDPPQRLWQAGARNQDGGLMDMNVLDLQNASTVPSRPELPLFSDPPSFVNIDDLLDSPMPKLPPQPTSHTTVTPVTSSHPRKDPGRVSLEAVRTNTTITTTTDLSFVDIDDLLNSPMPKPPLQPASHTAAAASSSHSKKGPDNVFVEATSSKIITTAATEVARPNYDLFTDAQLARQISSYGFKPLKKRAAMISLLDECWTSKHAAPPSSQARLFSTSARSPSPARKKASEDATNNKEKVTKPRGQARSKKADKALNLPATATTTVAASVDPGPASPKRARGRPKKDETASASTNVTSSALIQSPKRPCGRPRKSNSPREIADSEDESPSSASSPERVFSSPPPLDLSTMDEADMSLTLSPTDQQAELFKQITKAVTSAPRSRDPSNPSWHEKMLLYDPIVLEELAAWLNSGQLSRAGHDGEVSPFDVKKWCESKSVICLWRQTLQGKERKRY
ncbi:hypothetical protein F5Y16DRAFT_345958 [Xylariaceae sp. FL0255]|nr:hypothetical protein F5Y16DRAFT_345958 [Xylariaceae sp. FL0255]